MMPSLASPVSAVGRIDWVGDRVEYSSEHRPKTTEMLVGTCGSSSTVALAPNLLHPVSEFLK